MYINSSLPSSPTISRFLSKQPYFGGKRKPSCNPRDDRYGYLGEKPRDSLTVKNYFTVLSQRIVKTRVAMPSSSTDEEDAAFPGATKTMPGTMQPLRGKNFDTARVLERIRLIDILRGVSSTTTSYSKAPSKDQRPWRIGQHDADTLQGDPQIGMHMKEKSSQILQEAQRCAKMAAIYLPLDDGRGRSGREEEEGWIKPVLDWLYVSPADITPRLLGYLASTYAYDKIHVIDVASMNIAEDTITDGVCWMGASRLPSGPVCLSAFLNRLKHRFKQRYNDGNSITILKYSPSTSYLTLHALALFFFMHCWLDESNARALAARAVEKQIPPVSIIDSGIEELAACGKGWLQRVIVEWPYHAKSSVDIAGEICGGWHITQRLWYDSSNRKWKIQIWGLKPGSYTFKFVVDGNWCVDLKRPLSVDDWGNDNNTATVIACGGLDSQTRAAVNTDIITGSTFESDYHDTKNDQRMVVVVEPNALASGGSAEERLRLARFGASLLSYYKKISYHNGATHVM